MATVDVMATLIDRGMLLESARGPLPNVAELVAGGPIKGSWWGHEQGHEIYDERMPSTNPPMSCA